MIPPGHDATKSHVRSPHSVLQGIEILRLPIVRLWFQTVQLAQHVSAPCVYRESSGSYGAPADHLEVGDGGSLVAAVHDIVGVGAGGGKHVLPDGGDLLVGLDGDDLGGAGDAVGSADAGDRVGIGILDGDGAVVLGDADTAANAVVDAANLEGGFISRCPASAALRFSSIPS